MGVVNLRGAQRVVILSGIGLVNYALLQPYRARGIHFTGLLGGLVNSRAVGALARRCGGQEEGAEEVALEGMRRANVAMMAWNGLIREIFALAALGYRWLAVWGMGIATGWLVFRAMREGRETAAPKIQPAFPFSLRQALPLGALHLAPRGAVVMAGQWLGTGGFLVVTFLRGRVRSASMTAAVAT
jgi:uncharacterized membrane protein (DUF4010 family)